MRKILKKGNQLQILHVPGTENIINKCFIFRNKLISEHSIHHYIEFYLIYYMQGGYSKSLSIGTK